MVDVLGHLAMGLFWATPAWALWYWRRTAAFVAVVLPAAVFPDVDLYVPSVTHHGVTHTATFVAVVAVLGGLAATAVTTSMRRRGWVLDEGGSPSRGWIFVFVATGLLVGGLSHVFMDLLSTASWERALNPFWPLFEKPFSVYYIKEFSSRRWNERLLVSAIALHVSLAIADLFARRARQ